MILYKNISMSKSGPKPINILERLMSKLTCELDETICWVPDLSELPHGYKKIGLEAPARGWTLAHRVVWEAHNAEPLGDRLVMHTCDNPGCINPAHLRAGNQFDNMQDCASKGRVSNQFITGDAYA